MKSIQIEKRWKVRQVSFLGALLKQEEKSKVDFEMFLKS